MNFHNSRSSLRLKNITAHTSNFSRREKPSDDRRYGRRQKSGYESSAELEPDANLALQFQAIAAMPSEEQRIIQELLEGMIIKYEAERWSSKAKR